MHTLIIPVFCSTVMAPLLILKCPTTSSVCMTLFSRSYARHFFMQRLHTLLQAHIRVRKPIEPGETLQLDQTLPSQLHPLDYGKRLGADVVRRRGSYSSVRNTPEVCGGRRSSEDNRQIKRPAPSDFKAISSLFYKRKRRDGRRFVHERCPSIMHAAGQYGIPHSLSPGVASCERDAIGA